MSKNFLILMTLARRVIVPLAGAAMSLGWISGAYSQQSAPVPVEAVGIPSSSPMQKSVAWGFFGEISWGGGGRFLAGISILSRKVLQA